MLDIIESVTWVKELIDTSKNHYMIVVKDGSVMSVPLDSDNADYQLVQKWVAEGNTISEPD
tara:strand:- start:97 stop:279 length:183 start_codon:yes stop_codon:yes gene_type:complete